MTKQDILKVAKFYEEDISMYEFIDDNELQFTIEDFSGFDEDWNEIDRELTTDIDAFIQWIKDNANTIEEDWQTRYIFDDTTVTICYASEDI
jgi:hypothetical protein